jgi:hypothetical protein
VLVPCRFAAGCRRRQGATAGGAVGGHPQGAWIYRSDAKRKAWAVDGPHFLGRIISHMQLDPRDGRTLLAAAKTGHLGPTFFRC